MKTELTQKEIDLIKSLEKRGWTFLKKQSDYTFLFASPTGKIERLEFKEIEAIVNSLQGRKKR